MFEDMRRRFEEFSNASGVSPHIKATVEVGDKPPTEIFPIPQQYNYCNLAQIRGAAEVSLTLQKLDHPRQAATYTLKTGDLARVRQWVLDEGFSPSWDWMHFQFERFADHEGEYYFFSRFALAEGQKHTSGSGVRIAGSQ